MVAVHTYYKKVTSRMFIKSLIDNDIQPLKIQPNSKAPSDDGWNNPEFLMTSEEAEALETLVKNKQANLGILCGSFSEVIGIDIDSDNEVLIKRVGELLGFTPSIKKGRRGETRFYRYNGERGRKLKFPNDQGHIDILSDSGEGHGKNCVIPPSIHPDTKEPFKWVGMAAGIVKENLPKITTQQMDNLIAEMHLETRTTKKKESATPYIRGAFQELPEVRELIEECLDKVSPDCSYEEWRDIGFAVNYAITKDEGAEIFTKWSARSPKWGENLEKNTLSVQDIFFNENHHRANTEQITTSTLLAKVPTPLLSPEKQETLRLVQGNIIQAKVNLGALPGLIEDNKEVYYDDSYFRKLVYKKCEGNVMYVVGEGMYHLENNVWVHHPKDARGFLVDKYEEVIDEVTNTIAYQMSECRNADGVITPNKVKKNIAALKSVTKVSAVTSGLLAAKDKFHCRHPDDLNRPLHVVSTPSGEYVDLQTGEGYMPENDTKDFTRNITVNYDPTASALEWEKLLAKTFAKNKDPIGMISLLQQFFGYCLTGETNLQKVFVFYGSGANGKSTIINALVKLMGTEGSRGFATVQSAEVFAKKTYGKQASKELALIMGNQVGRRLVSVADIASDAHWHEDVIKAITEETTTTRRLFEDEVTVRITAKFLFSTNDIPTITDGNHGLTRRFCIVPFKNRFQTNEDSANADTIATQIDNMMPAIFKWAVEGAMLYYAQGRQIKFPKECLLETQQYIDLATPLESAIAKACGTPGTGGFTDYHTAGEIAAVLAAYLRHIAPEGDFAELVSPVGLGRKLTKLGYARRSTKKGIEYNVKLQMLEFMEQLQ